MNVVKCKNGHFFDGDTYEACPHCGSGVAPTVEQDSQQKKKSLFGQLSGKIRSSSQHVATPSSSGQSSSSTGNSTSQQSSGEVSRQPEVKSAEQNMIPNMVRPNNSSKSKGRTIDFWDVNTSDSTLEGHIEELPKEQSIEAAEENAFVEASSNDSLDRTENQAPAANEKEDIPLRDAIKQASANSSGKTLSYFSAMSNDDSKQEKAGSAPRPTDPVVGWLVCIKGKHLGESFCIYAGANSIGREDSNRIVLSKDPSVSRSKHAILTFEPKHSDFYLKPGESSGLTYVNDEFISETKKLAARDIIEIGYSQLMLIPLCGESFSWEEYLKR